MDQSTVDTLIKAALILLSIGGTIAVTLGGIMIRRLYKSIDLLFEKDEERAADIEVLKLVTLRSDPESTSLFNALTAGRKLKKPGR